MGECHTKSVYSICYICACVPSNQSAVCVCMKPCVLACCSTIRVRLHTNMPLWCSHFGYAEVQMCEMFFDASSPHNVVRFIPHSITLNACELSICIIELALRFLCKRSANRKWGCLCGAYGGTLNVAISGSLKRKMKMPMLYQ